MAKHQGANHTNCRKGLIVRIKTRDGQVYEDKFIERKHGRLFFEKIGSFSKAEIRQFKVLHKKDLI